MATGGSGDEIETDAVPYHFSSISAFAPLKTNPSTFIGKKRSYSEKEHRALQCTEDYQKYIQYMPSHLKHDNFDILLLYSREDYREVKRFQRRIQKDCFVTEYGERRNPVIKLEDEYVQLHDNPTKSLDVAYKKALYVFLFVTQAFCEQDLNLFKGHACLTNALEDKRWCVIPVQTEDRETRRKKHYTLPMMLNALQAINYWDKNFYREAVERLLDSKMSHLIGMNLDLEDDREKYFQEHEHELIRRHKYQLNRMNRRRMSNSPRKPVAPRHKYPVEEQGEKPKLDSLKMKGSDSASELKLEYGSIGYRSDLKSNPDGLNPSSNEAYGPQLGSTYTETRPSFSDSDLHMYTANPTSHSGHVGEDHFNVQEIQNALPYPVPSTSPTSSNHPSFFSSNSDPNVSTEVHPPSSFSSLGGRGTLHQESDEILTSEHSTSDHRASSDESGLLDSKKQAFVTASVGSSTEPTDSANPSVHHNLQSNSKDASNDTSVVHHHHHHYHKHVQIETVEYMALGKIAKIHVNTGLEDSNEKDEDGESNEHKEGEEHDHSDSKFHRDETDLKTTTASSSGSTRSSNQGVHPGEEETCVKWKESPPPSYHTEMGFPELTDPYTSTFSRSHGKYF